jgi:hypothetical protein
MKKIKIVFWALLVAFVAILGYQNQEFFLYRGRLDLNLGVAGPYTTPELYNAVLFLAFFVAGFLIAYFSGLFERFRSGKVIKQLNAAIEAQKKEIDSLTRERVPAPPTPAEGGETPTTVEASSADDRHSGS